jgi:hypothetical protein
MIKIIKKPKRQMNSKSAESFLPTISFQISTHTFIFYLFSYFKNTFHIKTAIHCRAKSTINNK